MALRVGGDRVDVGWYFILLYFILYSYGWAASNRYWRGVLYVYILHLRVGGDRVYVSVVLLQDLKARTWREV